MQCLGGVGSVGSVSVCGDEYDYDHAHDHVYACGGVCGWCEYRDVG